MTLSAFVAYSSSAQLAIEAIRNAVNSIKHTHSAQLQIKTWEELDIPGRFIATEVLGEIDSADFLIADISKPNFNVFYEIGYAIGKGRRVLLIKHRSISDDISFNELGLFDTLGWKVYSNGGELAEILKAFNDVRPLHLGNKVNPNSPVYFVQPKHKTDYDGYILASIKKAPLRFRSFDPTETPRLGARDAIANVSQSIGVVLHFLPTDNVDAPLHNLRTSFVAGLSDGMDKEKVFIQSGEGPVPLDYRDFVVPCRYQDEFHSAVVTVAEKVFEILQEASPQLAKGARSRLEDLDLGASAAENEMTTLAEYYVEIPAYRRALRKEVRLVTGRKGSGKTAIFFRLRDTIRASRQNVVLDLKPEGYQLLKLKDNVVRMMSSGTVEHTITAFWEYILWIEICYKLLEKDQDTHARDNRLFEPYQRLKAVYLTDEYSREGDFAERLKALLRSIVLKLEAKYPGQTALSLNGPEITELVYQHDFAKLKGQVQEYLHFKGELWLLFDNLDKGWTSKGVNMQDLVMVRALIEATRKIERDLQRKGVTAHTVIFLRNDVFENLVDTTSDRGKETRANVDWDDPEMLRELIRRRLIRDNTEKDEPDFRTAWTSICTPFVNGEDSSQYLIDRCLMRPRSLLDLIGHCRGQAVNLGHEKITKEDIAKGLSTFSNDLLSELDMEIRDVWPKAEQLLYAFIGSSATLSRDALLAKLRAHGVVEDQLESLIELMFWFGFLGFLWTNGEPRFIYSFHYNMKVLEGTHKQLLTTGITYALNPAFELALGLV